MKMFFNHRLSRTTLTNVRVGGARTPAAPNAPALVLRLFGCAKYIRKVSLMLACMLCAFALNAATWYVDAANGSDENAGTSWEISLATIQSAVDKSSSGDTILVGDGEYASFTLYDPKIDYHGGYKQLSIKTVGGPKKTTINAGEVKIGDGYYSSDVTGSSSLEGFTLKGGSFSVKGPGTIKRCIITQVNGAHAVHYCKVYNGIFYENAVSASELIGAKLYNCTIYENHGKYIACDSLGGALHNCIYYGNNLGVYDGAGGPWRNYAYNCFSADPKFVDLDAGDLRLLSTSPCIDAGSNAYVASGDTDVAGKPRVNGGTVDIGAYEYYPAGCTLSNVSCRQRYPWNGKVDVNFSLSGSDDVQYAVKLEVEDLVGGTNLPMRTVSKKGGAAVNRNGEFVYPGAHRWVWDAGADLPDGFESERVVVKVNSLDDATSTYTVRFNANGGKGTMENEVYVYGIESTLPPNRFSFDGCEFQGWAAIIGGSRFFSDGDRIFNLTDTNKKVIDLYAIWKPIDHTRLYMVIDLSAGADAEAYSISYLAGIPDGGWTDEYKTTKLVLRRIEPGTFKMCGQYNVTLTRPFYIGVFEVTQKQYELLTGVNPSYWGKGDTRPVACLTYYGLRGESEGQGWPASSAVDSTSVLGKLRSRTGLDFDLPTEAQWEYACRAGTTSTYNNGGDSEDDLKTVGRYIKNASDGNGGNGGYSSSYAVVGSYLPNAWGLYDMHGNVHEWCLDRCTQALNGLADDMIDPKGIETSDGGEVHMRLRIVRGGSFHRDAASCSSGQRRWDTEGGTNSYYDYGLRLCLPL